MSAEPSRATPAGDRPIVLAAIAAVAFGCLIRLVQWSGRRSLWLDEASLAVNIVHRSWGDLSKPLWFNQGAPVGFLYGERAAVLVLGNNEYALRFWPLLFGCLTVELTRRVATRLWGPRVALVAVVLVATSPALIRYSNEVKQYSVDCALALLLVLCGLRLAERSSAGRWAGLSAVGAASLWFSHPAALVLGGVFAFIGIRSLVRRDGRGVRNTALACLPIVVSFVVLYQVNLRQLTGDELLLDFWQDGLAPRPLTPVSFVRWIGEVLLGGLDHPVGARFAALGAVAVALGLVAAARHRPDALILAPPILMALAAAALRQYPFQGRLILFLVPLTFILLSAAVEWAWRTTDRSRPVAVVGVLALLVVTFGSGVVDGARSVSRIHTVNEARPVFQHVGEHAAPDDLVVVFYGSQPSYYYYEYLTDVRADWDLYPSDERGRCPSLALEGRRAWIVFAYDYLDRSAALERLRSMGTLVSGRTFPDAGVYLFDFPAPAPTGTPGSRQVPCLKLQQPLDFGPTDLGTRPFGQGARS